MGILIPILALCIPIVAIGGSFWYKVEKLRIENGQLPSAGGGGKKVDAVLKENAELRQRVENLELIVSELHQLEVGSPPPKSDKRQ